MVRRSEGRELQSWGAERLKARLPMVTRLAEGTESWRVEEERSERAGVATWRRSDMYGGARLCSALNVMRSILKLILCFMGSQWSCCRTGVMC